MREALVVRAAKQEFERRLVGEGKVASAGVSPLPARWGPDLLPAVVAIRSVGVKNRSANECKIVDMAAMSEASRIVESAAATPVYERCAAGDLPPHSRAGPMQGHSRRCRDNCRRDRGRGNAAGKLGHHFNPPGKPATQSAARPRQMKDSTSSGLDKLDMR